MLRMQISFSILICFMMALLIIHVAEQNSSPWRKMTVTCLLCTTQNGILPIPKAAITNFKQKIQFNFKQTWSKCQYGRWLVTTAIFSLPFLRRHICGPITGVLRIGMVTSPSPLVKVKPFNTQPSNPHYLPPRHRNTENAMLDGLQAHAVSLCNYFNSQK